MVAARYCVIAGALVLMLFCHGFYGARSQNGSAEICQQVVVDPQACTLEDALSYVVEMKGVYLNGTSCFNISVKAGNYSISKHFIVKSTNIAIYGDTSDGPVYVTFDFGIDKEHYAKSQYFLLFEATEFVEIVGIQFEHSAGIIGFVNISAVTIKDSSFRQVIGIFMLRSSNECKQIYNIILYIYIRRWFSQGAVDMYQSFYIEVSNSIFEHNGPVFILRGQQYRGHAGGMSIGFDDERDPESSQPERIGAFIESCRFLNNTSNPRAINSDVFNTSQVIESFLFPGRGGALAITVNSSFEFNVVINNCHVEDNYASSFGGGIYLVFSGYSSHTIQVNNTVFVNNTSGSGGLTLGYLEKSGNGEGLSLEVLNSHFEDNHAKFGGGIYLYAGSELCKPWKVLFTSKQVRSHFESNYSNRYK